MKRCPYCAEEIQDAAIKCKHCGSMLNNHNTDTLDMAETLLDRNNIPQNNQTDSLDGKPTIVNSHVDEQKPSSGTSEETQEKAGKTSEKDFKSRYEILSTIGAGGMGVVYKVRDRKLGREVAIKRLKGKIDAAKRGIDRFLQEARAIATLNHRNIVTIYELGEDNAGPFIVMEYVHGQNIQDRIEKEGKIELPQALSIIKEVGQALAYAHKRSIIHRDIKPSNIIITEDGTPKLLDFGLAQLGRESELSVTGYGMGTLAYMAPEQKRDAKHADQRADIYALAKTLYHMVTGEYPDAVDLDMVSTEIRPALKRSLKPKPEDRQFTVEEFLKELQQSNKFPVAATPGNSQVGTCISCGASNPEDVRFCQTCGAGLFEKCPKCNKEDRVGVKHCGSCGINIARFKEAQDALSQAQNYLEEKKYSRAIKEAKRALQTGYMKEELLQIQNKAKGFRQKIENLQQSIQPLIEKEDYEKAQKLLSEALELDPSLDDLKKMQEELPKRIVKRDMEKAQKAFADKELEIALDIIGRVLELDSINEEALNLKNKIQRSLKIRKKTRNRRIVTVIIILGICASIVWSGADNRHRIIKAERLVAAGEAYAAERALSGCGWFCSWGKSDVAAIVRPAVEKARKIDEAKRKAEAERRRIERLKCPTCKGDGKCTTCSGRGESQVAKWVKCSHCRGDGRFCTGRNSRGNRYVTCSDCGGKGGWRINTGVKCDSCGGTGKCSKCNGTGKNSSMK